MEISIARTWTRGSVAWRRSFGRAAAALAVMAVGAVLLDVTGTIRSTVATLVVMGFDPDRGRLIAALSFEAVLVAAAVIALGPTRAVYLGGAGFFALAYRRTFLAETDAALVASGPQGTFDPVGWAVTALTLVVAVAIAAWAAASLARIARRGLERAAAEAAAFVRGDHAPGRLRAPAAVVAVVATLVVALPVFGDMVNFEPDAHMRRGAPAGPALTDTGAAPGAGAAQGLGPALLDRGGLWPGGSSDPTAVLSRARPWQAWAPTGAGSIASITVPAPWNGVPAPQQTLSIYLPPGYGTSTISYPVMYTAPFGLPHWQTSVGLPAALDDLIDSGAMPATIVVFVTEYGGPYSDSECADSTDGREWFESWVVDTVVPAIDQQYRTMASPAARSFMGFSQGGYCAAMFALRHPDVFATAISFSGYFQAGIVTGQTPNAWRPFGRNAAAEAAVSPIDLAPRIPPDLRSKLFFELIADPSQPFYGPQYAEFAKVLGASRIPFETFPTLIGHSWAEMRANIPAVLETLGAREAALGVFGS